MKLKAESPAAPMSPVPDEGSYWIGSRVFVQQALSGDTETSPASTYRLNSSIRHQPDEPLPQRDIFYVCGLIRTIGREAPQTVPIDPMTRRLPRQLWLGIDRFQSHLSHQLTDPLHVDCIARLLSQSAIRRTSKSGVGVCFSSSSHISPTFSVLSRTGV